MIRQITREPVRSPHFKDSFKYTLMHAAVVTPTTMGLAAFVEHGKWQYAAAWGVSGGVTWAVLIWRQRFHERVVRRNFLEEPETRKRKGKTPVERVVYEPDGTGLSPHSYGNLETPSEVWRIVATYIRQHGVSNLTQKSLTNYAKRDYDRPVDKERFAGIMRDLKSMGYVDPNERYAKNMGDRAAAWIVESFNSNGVTRSASQPTQVRNAVRRQRDATLAAMHHDANATTRIVPRDPPAPHEVVESDGRRSSSSVNAPVRRQVTGYIDVQGRAVPFRRHVHTVDDESAEPLYVDDETQLGDAPPVTEIVRADTASEIEASPPLPLSVAGDAISWLINAALIIVNVGLLVLALEAWRFFEVFFGYSLFRFFG